MGCASVSVSDPMPSSIPCLSLVLGYGTQACRQASGQQQDVDVVYVFHGCEFLWFFVSINLHPIKGFTMGRPSMIHEIESAVVHQGELYEWEA